MLYNGWSNRETRLVNVWFDPESKEGVQLARSVIEDQYDAMENGVLKDMISINSIDWNQLESYFNDEDNED